MSDEARWHIVDGHGVVSPPLTESQLRREVEAGRVDATTWVWSSHEPGWCRLGDTVMATLASTESDPYGATSDPGRINEGAATTSTPATIGAVVALFLALGAWIASLGLMGTLLALTSVVMGTTIVVFGPRMSRLGRVLAWTGMTVGGLALLISLLPGGVPEEDHVACDELSRLIHEATDEEGLPMTDEVAVRRLEEISELAGSPELTNHINRAIGYLRYEHDDEDIFEELADYCGYRLQ